MLYIVATPIGNLEDISLRALRILREVDFILCEDTRVTKKLLDHYDIKAKTMSYHQHSDQIKNDYVINLMKEGKDLALVSDAGTPAISDPGGKLVAAVVEEFGDDARVESVPGPSAVTAALSISGIPTDKFVFMGFAPNKKGRMTFIKKIIKSEYPVVVYESKHRIIKFLEELKKLAEEYNKNVEKINKKVIKNSEKLKEVFLTSVVVCREISKMHEIVYRGGIDEMIEKIKNAEAGQKGEFVVIVGK